MSVLKALSTRQLTSDFEPFRSISPKYDSPDMSNMCILRESLGNDLSSSSGEDNPLFPKHPLIREDNDIYGIEFARTRAMTNEHLDTPEVRKFWEIYSQYPSYLKKIKRRAKRRSRQNPSKPS